MQTMLAGLGSACTLICAPAGFGKSAAAAELGRRSQLPVAWLSLDLDDNDPSRFGAYLVEAIRQSGIALGEEIEAMLQFTEPPSLEALMAAVINTVAAAGSHCVFVMDDYHSITADEIHKAVANLLHHRPPNVHVVISTRLLPPLPLARLKARGEISEVTAADLRLSEQEASALLKETMGFDLPEDGIADLMARTEGWIAGLKLAALSLRGASDWRTAIQRFNGRHPDVLNYLVDEVVHQQPDSNQTFLRATAILDRLTGSLCDAVTGAPGGHQTLQSLAQANLFLAPLDAHGQWYRYHPLFAECLRTQLLDTVGEPQVMQLHRRAAAWFGQNGQLEEEIEHLLAARAYEEAADRLEAGLSEWSPSVPPATLWKWVSLIPREAVRKRPRLCTMAAWALINGADGLADHLYVQAVEFLGMASDALRLADVSVPAVRESLGVVAAVRTALAPWAPSGQGRFCTMQDVAQAADCAENARALLPEDSLFWRSVVTGALGQVYLRAGSVSRAAQAFGAAGRLGTRSGNLTASIAALSRQGQLLTLLGQTVEADKIYREALDLAVRHGGERLSALAPIYMGLGSLRYEWNDLTAAEAMLAEARTRYEMSGAAAPELLLATARVHHARGDTAMARLLVDEARDLLAARPKLRAASVAAWPQGVRILLAHGDVHAARRWVVEGGVTADPQPVLWRIPEYLALARVQVAEGQAEASLPLLSSLRGVADVSGCRGLEVEICLVAAHALYAMHDDEAAREYVRGALAATAPDQFVRTFADEGRPIVTLLRQVNGELQRGEHASEPYAGYVQRLLGMLALDRGSQVAALAPVAGSAPLAQPLTEREEEIIKLVAAGCSNQEVARELFLGLSTVKWHLLNIYGKLQVQSRTQAVAHARQLGLV